MAHIGKIGFHFPDRGNPNLDTYDIKFLPAGQTASSIDDFAQVNKVYAIPAGVTISTVADLQNYIVWELSRTLLAGNQDVAIKYIPRTNITVDHLAIFTDVTSTGNTPHIKIFHESGLIVAATDGDVQGSSEQKYGLTGSKHTAAINNVTLYAGQTYYIVYSHGYGGTAFYPAYFQDAVGDYKVYKNETSTSQVEIHNISPNATYLKPAKFKGVLTNSMGIFSFQENDWFVWNGSTQTGMTVGQVYRRTDVGTGYQFSGIIGNPNDYHTIDTTDFNNLLSKPLNSDFIWYIDGTANMNRSEIWAKPSTWNVNGLLDFSNINGEQLKTANLLYEIYNHTEVMITGGTFWYNNVIGYSGYMKSGYYSGVTSLTPLAQLPSSPVENTLYFLAQSATGHWEDAIFVYTNGNYTKVDNNNILTFIGYDPLSSKLVKVGTNQDLLNVITNADSNFLNATEYTDKKFYLEINGGEV